MSLKDFESDYHIENEKSSSKIKFDIETNKYVEEVTEEEKNRLLHEKIHKMHQD